MKKVLCLILAMLMTATLLVSCVNGGKDEVTTQAPDQTTEPGDSEGGDVIKEDKPFDPTEMKARHEAEDKIMYVLCWNSEHDEFDMLEEEASADTVKTAIFERNNLLKAKLGLTDILWNEQDGNSDSVNDYLKYVETVAQNGDVEIDVIATYSRSAGLLSQKGFLLPVNFYKDYIDLTHSWYPEALIDEVNIGGNRYFVSGDISTNLIYLTYGFIFNKDLLSDLGIDHNYLYELVDEGKWTLDEMFKLVGNYHNDVDQNGTKSTADGFGLRSYNYHLDAFYTGSGLKLVEIDNNATDPKKLVVVSADYGSKKSIDLNDRLGQLFTSDYACNDNPATPFAERQNDIAEVTRIRDLRAFFNEGVDECEYGVLPLPKYDLNQEDYKCVAGNPFTLWGIYSGNYDLEREESAAGFIEWAGYYGMLNTTEAIFEYLFKGRYADQPDDANSFDTIRRTTSFDIGRIFTTVISPNAAIADQWSNCAAKGSKWSSIYSSLIRGYTDNAKKASQDFWNLKETLKNPYEFPYEN